MSTLKIDLLNNLNNQKYFEEKELIRLVGDTSMNYKLKIDEITTILQNIALINSQIALTNQYLVEQNTVTPNNNPVQGQSHTE